MNYIKRNKEIFIQIIAFSIIGLLFKKYYLLFFVLILIGILPFRKISNKYIYLLNKLIFKIGWLIKTILFSLLFIFIICPISIFKKRTKNNSYILRNKTFEPIDFEKMW